MNSTALSTLFTLVLVTVTLSHAATYFGQPFAMPRKRSPAYLDDSEEKRATYLGFPRLGRGYLALPRMGRSHESGSGSDVTNANNNGADCCATGLKKEWDFGEGGKLQTKNVCESDACCPGYQEVQSSKPDGTFYSMCVPSCQNVAAAANSDAVNENVMLKLRRLLRN